MAETATTETSLPIPRGLVVATSETAKRADHLFLSPVRWASWRPMGCNRCAPCQVGWCRRGASAGTPPGSGAIDLHQRRPNGRARWHPGAGEAYGGPAPAGCGCPRPGYLRTAARRHHLGGRIGGPELL